MALCPNCGNPARYQCDLCDGPFCGFQECGYVNEGDAAYICLACETAQQEADGDDPVDLELEQTALAYYDDLRAMTGRP